MGKMMATFCQGFCCPRLALNLVGQLVNNSCGHMSLGYDTSIYSLATSDSPFVGPREETKWHPLFHCPSLSSLARNLAALLGSLPGSCMES